MDNRGGIAGKCRKSGLADYEHGSDSNEKNKN